MIDLSHDISEKKDFSLPPEAPKYPYGLRITLTAKELQKLNISEIPPVGKKFKADIQMEVIEVSAQDGEGSEKEHRVELQIKEMDIEKEESEKEKSKTTIIYGE